MKKYTLIFSVFVSLRAFSQMHTPDEALKTCLDSAMNTVTMTECYDKGIKAWDKALNTQYQAVMSKITDKRQRNEFREAQRRWIAYRDNWMKAAKHYYYDTQGTMAPLSVGEQQIMIIKNQAKLLASMNAH